MAQIGVAVLEEARSAGERLEDPLRQQRRADRLIARAQALGDRDDVGGDPFLLARVQRAGAAHAAHHLVQDQQHAVAVAHVAHAAEVPGHRRHDPGRCTADRLGDERDHTVRAGLHDGRIQFGGQALAVLLGCFRGAPVAVFVAGADVHRIDQQRRERLAAPGVAADGQRAQRVAVIALAPRDEQRALRLTDLDEVLPGHLQCGLDRLGAARHEVRVTDPGRCRGDQRGRQLLGDVGGEKRGVRIADPLGLRLDRLDHGTVAVPQARHRGATAGVQVPLAVLVDQVGAVAGDHARVGAAGLPMQDAGH